MPVLLRGGKFRGPQLPALQTFAADEELMHPVLATHPPFGREMAELHPLLAGSDSDSDIDIDIEGHDELSRVSCRFLSGERMRSCPTKTPIEVRNRSVRTVLDRLDNYPSLSATRRDLLPKLNIGVETLRKWTIQAQADAGIVPGPTSVQLDEIRVTKREVKDLEETIDILKAPTFFFARELDPRHH